MFKLILSCAAELDNSRTKSKRQVQLIVFKATIVGGKCLIFNLIYFFLVIERKADDDPN